MIVKNCPHHAELDARWRALADFAANFRPLRMPIEPCPSDIREINHDLRELAYHVDAVVKAYGELLHAYGPGLPNLASFDAPLWGALEGYATFDVDDSAERLVEALMDDAR